MNDMRSVIVPKSDQLNADDLIGGPITITIREVTIRPHTTEQPVSIFYEGDNGKPYKCCKIMARVMVHCWGPDAAKYVGKSMTLYRDPEVKWAGLKVGGIRISHMTDIPETVTMALTETKGSKKPFTVKPLRAGDAPTAETPIWQRRVNTLAAALAGEKSAPAWLEILEHGLEAAGSDAEIVAIDQIPGVQQASKAWPKEHAAALRAKFASTYRRLAGRGAPSFPDDDFPGEVTRDDAITNADRIEA